MINRQAYVRLLEISKICQEINQSLQALVNQTRLTEAERSQLNQIEKQLCELRQEIKQLGFTLIGITSYPYSPLATENFHP